jgi:predicted phosphodiesterase
MGEDIERLGSVGEGPGCDAETLHRLWWAGRVGMRHGERFTGRPATAIHSAAGWVLKVRTELDLPAPTARRWVQRSLEQERTLGVHHPDKTWCLITPRGTDQDSERPRIASATPHLTPLHLLLTPARTDPGRGLALLEDLLATYLRVARAFDLRLDEGLSNFAVDAQDRLYYLDDEVYRWDGFLTLSQLLGVYCRQLPWLDEASAGRLGTALAETLAETFPDPHQRRVLADRLEDVFQPDPGRRRVTQALAEALRGRPRRPAPLRRPSGRYLALLADVHANLPALEAVLGFLAERGIADGLVLGDVVGYGPHPGACVDRLQASGLTVLMGNHDHAAGSGSVAPGFSENARWAIAWSMDRLSAAQREWLAELPPYLEGEDWLAVHGAPMDPTYFNAYVYHMTFEANLDALVHRGVRLGFHGHTHMPTVYARRPGRTDALLREAALDLAPFGAALICPGSVGQPRDGVPQASLAVYDREARRLTLHRVPYAVEETVAEMRAQGFPRALYERLVKGR